MAEHIPPHVPPEQRYAQVRKTFASGGPVSRDIVREVLGICGQLLNERQRMRAALDRMAPAFGEVRQGLAEIHRTIPETEPQVERPARGFGNPAAQKAEQAERAKRDAEAVREWIEPVGG